MSCENVLEGGRAKCSELEVGGGDPTPKGLKSFRGLDEQIAIYFCLIAWSSDQKLWPGLVNFVCAVAYHYLALPAVFMQPGSRLLSEPCNITGSAACSAIRCRQILISCLVSNHRIWFLPSPPSFFLTSARKCCASKSVLRHA